MVRHGDVLGRADGQAAARAQRELVAVLVASLQAHEPIRGCDVGLRAVAGGEGDRLAVSQGPGCEMGHCDVERVQGADAMGPGDLKRNSLDILLR